MYTYAAGSPGTFGAALVATPAQMVGAIRIGEIQEAIAIAKDKAPEALPILYNALGKVQQAMAVPAAVGTTLLAAADVDYSVAQDIAKKADATLPALRQLRAQTMPLKRPQEPREPAARAPGADFWSKAQIQLQRKYGPLQAWQWAALAGGGIVVVSMAYKMLKFALLGGALAGGALLVTRAGGVKLP